MPKVIEEFAPKIFDAVEKADSILLHCHPLPDPDSVGSALALKIALNKLGKKATVIRGDSQIPKAFYHFPGVREIEDKDFTQVSLDDFDLFISLDSGSKEMITQKMVLSFPLSIKTIVIDHHVTNELYGDINLLDPSSSSTAFIIFQLLKSWKIDITHDIALNLFIGIYTDTGGFKYPPTDYRVLEAVAELAKVAPDFTEALFTLENSQDKGAIYFQALALSSVQTFLNDNLVISTVSSKDLSKKNISEEYIRGISISNILKSVVGWNVAVSLVEREPNKIKVSCRTRDSSKFDVSLLAKALGGGGHRAAAAANLNMSLEEALKKVVETAKIIYNL